MALSPHEPLRLCGECLGVAYGGRLPPRVSIKVYSQTRVREDRFEVEPGTCGRCALCRGSGFENATTREAFEREHRQGAEPAIREADDPRVLSLLP